MKAKNTRLVFIIAYLAYSAVYFSRVNLTMANPELVGMGLLTTEQIGMLGGAFSAVFASGRLINGALSDKAPPWLMISGGLLACAVCNIAIGFFPPFIAIFLLWSVNAYAQSMLWGSLISVMSSIYDEQTAKKRTAFLSTTVAVGNIAGILICTLLITRLGVRFAFIVPGAVTLVLSLCVALSMLSVRPEKGGKSHLSMLSLIKNREILRICIPAALHGIMKENISLWMTVYVIDTYGVDLGGSAYYLLLIPAFGFVGRVGHAFFYRIFKENEHSVSVLGFVLIAAFSVMCVIKVSAIYGIICLTAVYAAVSLVNTSFLSIYPIRFRAEGNVSSVSGVLDFVTYIGASVSALVYGYIIEPLGYSAMFISWAVLAVPAIIVLIPFAKKENKEV